MLNSKVLVTGGAGFIGSHIVDKLLAEKFSIVVLDNLLSGTEDNLPKSDDVRLYCVDIEKDNLDKIFKIERPDYVIHLAAQTSVSYSVENAYFDANVNIMATIRLLECCKKYAVKKIIAASSAAVYGNPQYLPIDENHPTEPISPYGLSKLSMEKYIQMSDVPWVIFRFSNVFGPRQKSSKESGVVAIFDKAMKSQLPINIYGDGWQIRDFVYVEDIATICVRVMTSTLTNEIINFSTNKGVSINELFDNMKTLYNYPQVANYLQERDGDIKDSVLSNNKVLKIFNDIRYTSLSDGLTNLEASMPVNARQKKILIVTQPEVMDTVGGAITVFVNFCNMLSENNYIVSGCYYNNRIKDSTPPHNIKHSVNFSNLYYEYNKINFSDAINGKISDECPDLIIFFFLHLYKEAKLSSEFDDIPKILMFHSRPDFYLEQLVWSGKKVESLYKNTIVQVLFDSYRNLLPDFIKQENVVVIPNSVSRQEKILNTEIEHKKIIYLSRIDCWKGLEFLIHSFKIIADKYKDWSIDIYGQSQPPEYVKQLEILTQKLGIDSQINFKGITSNSYETFLHYDFCVFPSYFEGFPMGLLEAQSVGLPSLGLKGCSGVNELIIDGFNGYLADESYEDFASKIEKLILDKLLRKEFGKNSILEAQKYVSENINNQWLELIGKVINKAPYFSKKIGDFADKNIVFFPIDKILQMAYQKKRLKWYQRVFSVTNIHTKTGKKKSICVLGIKFVM